MNSPRRVPMFVQLVGALGFACVLMLTILVPLHHMVAAAGYTYYREFFSGLIAMATLVLWTARTNAASQTRLSLYVLAGVLFVVVMSVLDSGQKLYPETDEAQISDQLYSVNQTLYVLRNYLLYIPVFAFLSAGLRSSRQLKLLAWVIACMGPVAIVEYVRFYGGGDLSTLGSLATIGPQFFAYNSFVPHLTFSLLAALFLLFETKSQLQCVVLVTIVAWVTLYMFVSTSRQSMIFVVLAVLTFFLVNQKRRTVSIYAVALGLVCVLSLGARYFLSQPGVNEMLVRRSSLAGYMENNGRPEAVVDGLARVRSSQWFTGAGLTAVINSGPHNDFVRWLQRIGIFGMLVTFLPFAYGFTRGVAAMIKVRSPLSTFVCLGLGYTLYHSLFGYPREDAYQALYCWVGLGIFAACHFSTDTVKASYPAASNRVVQRRALARTVASTGRLARPY